jgi:primary-amine oxidase
MNTRALPAGPANPSGTAFAMRETVLARERQARRSLDPSSARVWSVVNPSVRTALGHPASYMLVPGTNAVPYLAPTSTVRKRAGFVDHHLWVTRRQDDELFAAGAYPNQSTGGDGLPRWAADDEPLVGQDVVLWYTMGITHIPRPEEWPIMPVAHLGFKLIPAGFFERNPALDVPR